MNTTFMIPENIIPTRALMPDFKPSVPDDKIRPIKKKCSEILHEYHQKGISLAQAKKNLFDALCSNNLPSTLKEFINVYSYASVFNICREEINAYRPHSACSLNIQVIDLNKNSAGNTAKEILPSTLKNIKYLCCRFISEYFYAYSLSNEQLTEFKTKCIKELKPSINMNFFESTNKNVAQKLAGYYRIYDPQTLNKIFTDSILSYKPRYDNVKGFKEKPEEDKINDRPHKRQKVSSSQKTTTDASDLQPNSMFNHKAQPRTINLTNETYNLRNQKNIQISKPTRKSTR